MLACPLPFVNIVGEPRTPGTDSRVHSAHGPDIELAYLPPFDAGALLAFLAQRAIPGVEDVMDGRYRRTVALGDATGITELEPIAGAARVVLRTYLFAPCDPASLVQRSGHLFDLDADPAAIAQTLGADHMLGPLVQARPGLRVPGAFDGFEQAVRAILGQQVSVAGARTLAGRLVASLGQPLCEPRGTLTHLFPTPDVVASSDLEGLGLTRARAAALRVLARAIGQGLILEPGADREQTEARLLALPGIGPWTASYIALRALGDRDALPAADLGLRRAFERHGLAGDPKSIAARAEAWRPWRAYAVMHLWASLSG